MLEPQELSPDHRRDLLIGAGVTVLQFLATLAAGEPGLEEVEESFLHVANGWGALMDRPVLKLVREEA